MKKHACEIKLLPHGRKIVTGEGEKLMEVLTANSIFLRSDCGGKGVCKKCLVELADENGDFHQVPSCTCRVTGDMTVRIPDSSLMSAHIIDKAPTELPDFFTDHFKPGKTRPRTREYGTAVDLGTTTIAVYLCDLTSGTVISSVAVKNPQALYGDDVMSRIGAIGGNKDKLRGLQRLAITAVKWGVDRLLDRHGQQPSDQKKMVVAGNPTMIHILLGFDPAPIGTAPYTPAFTGVKQVLAAEIGMSLPNLTVNTLPLIAGFIGGDTLAAMIAVDLENEPPGTLLIDLGTNGELVLKGRDGFYATSCATGPAFEGAAISCGMQAIPGAINAVRLHSHTELPEYTVITKKGKQTEPKGICGSGIISAIAAFNRTGLIEKNGRIADLRDAPAVKTTDGTNRIILDSDRKQIAISQKDIRAVQLGKGALITGIEFLLRAAGMESPRKIIIAGAFGSFLRKDDLLTLGMIPAISPERIIMAGNAAGTGAIMALCDDYYFNRTKELARRIRIIDLATDVSFQSSFVRQLHFP